MRILAIDPGDKQSAFVLLNGKQDIESGITLNEDLLLELQENNTWADHLAIETIACYGMAVGEEVFETCYWIGRFVQAYAGEYTRIKRMAVKMNLCHNSRAKDSNIRQALIDRYGGQAQAIGGNKCKKCKGKGWFGTGRPVCTACKGAKWLNPPGPLHDMHGDDLWAALSVAVTYADSLTERTT